jgi:hypothetical protein
MPASPMLRIEFEDGGLLETRANRWVACRSRYYPDRWRFREFAMLSAGADVIPEPDGWGDVGLVRTVKQVTRLPYKTRKKPKE